MPVETADGITQTAHFYHHVGALGQGGNVPPPYLEYLIPPFGVGSDSQGTSNVIKNDHCVGKSVGQVCQLRNLVVVYNRVEAKPQALQHFETLAELGVRHHSFWRYAGGSQLWAGIPDAAMADATKPVAAGCGVGFQHRFDCLPKG